MKNKLTPLPEHTPITYKTLLKLLNTNGFKYSKAHTIKDSYLSVPEKQILVDNEVLGIYEYRSNISMEKDASYIDKSGCSICTPYLIVNLCVQAYPYFFKKDRLIINYVGTNESILEFLNTNFGPPFAGHECSNN